MKRAGDRRSGRRKRGRKGGNAKIGRRNAIDRWRQIDRPAFGRHGSGTLRRGQLRAGKVSGEGKSLRTHTFFESKRSFSFPGPSVIVPTERRFFVTRGTQRTSSNFISPEVVGISTEPRPTTRSFSPLGVLICDPLLLARLVKCVIP